MRIKICGITNLEDALVCSENRADALGFIFFKGSKRFIGYDEAKTIIKQLPFFIMKIGVFVNEDYTKVNEVAENIGLNGVQLHGDESTEYINRIRLQVIKSFRVNDEFDFSVLNNFHNCSFLLDTYSANEFGGSGKSFNWDLIPHDIRKKIILAGGISEENIEEVRRNIKPEAIDISSSLEDYPGKKNHTKVKSFLNIIKRLD
ncbi:MAG: phosphoribosylanthranilate isomerase [Calditrichia bacterium]|nr:phosphoribosylanthranilate isomerase [Calditrichia bacterium]